MNISRKHGHSEIPNETSRLRISIAGTGYVGLCTGVGLASLGHHVICIDVDRKKIDMIKRGVPPIFEEGIEKKMKDAVSSGLLDATEDYDYAVTNSDMTFIAVGTPSVNGSIDLFYVKSAARSIGAALRGKTTFHIVVMKSTVVPGTTESIVSIIEKESAKKYGQDFGVCVNPEFLREGRALHDFMNPDRIVIGTGDKKSLAQMEDLYKDFGAPIVRTNLMTAEMIKYASNAFLASKISFINELGNLCKKLGLDTYKVAEGMGYDKRIGRQFLDAGIGFGGSCFRKDAEAIIQKAKSSGTEMRILQSALQTNLEQPIKIIEVLEKRTELKGKTVALLGLAFKKDTDDVRDAPSICVIKDLLAKKCVINAYDPEATKNMKTIFPSINYTQNVQDALKGADACLILTEWEEFKDLKDDDFFRMKGKIIIEGRRVLQREKVKNFEGICW